MVLSRLLETQRGNAEQLGRCRMVIDIVFDNHPNDPNCRTGWGFGCLIRGFEKTVLFDTGGNGGVLLVNMKALRIEPKDVEVVVLSHIHKDHAGGLGALLERNSDLTVFMPQSFPDGIKDKVRSAGARAVEVQDPLRVCPGIHSLGEMGTQVKEQSLCLATQDGLVVVTGCAHPGIVEVVQEAREAAQEPVRFLVGGQHLGGVSEQRLLSLIDALREIGVERIAPCHCSRYKARSLMRQTFGHGFVSAGVGTRIAVNDGLKGEE